MKDKKIAFGSNLKILRKENGYTRARLAGVLGYSEKTIEKWEFGTALPSVENICKIAGFFKVTIDSLVYDPKREIGYFLAIDGGGTKTEFLLTDLEKREIARLVLGTSNPVDIGIENTKEILRQGIFKVCENVPLSEVSVFAGLAGGITGNNKHLINEFMSGFGFGCFDNGSDTENVLEIALKGQNGVAIIMGTGIIAFSQCDGKRYRIGGWGYHIDKGGSGYNLGSDAMYYALKYKDGRQGSKLLCDLIEKRLGKSLEDSISDIHAKGKAFVASFAPVVFEAYDKGDDTAKEIIDRNIKEVAEMITVGQRFLPEGKGRIVICGGLAHHKDILDEFLIKYLGKEVKVEFGEEAIINGALSLAEKIQREE